MSAVTVERAARATRAASVGRIGLGRLAFGLVGGATALLTARASSPLQLLVPTPRGPCAWAVVVGHGGGLLAGDEVLLELEVGPGATALVTTQAETKVYRSEGALTARQRLSARVAAGAALAWHPDPVSPFATARHDGRQRFDLEEGASLLAVDAVVAGRTARGERWSLSRHRSATEVRVGGRLVLSDALLLEPRPGGVLAARLGRFDAFATALLLGPRFAPQAGALLAELGSRPAERGAEVLAAASPLGDGLLLRCAATSPEGLARHLRQALGPALAALGAAPFAHRW